MAFIFLLNIFLGGKTFLPSPRIALIGKGSRVKKPPKDEHILTKHAKGSMDTFVKRARGKMDTADVQGDGHIDDRQGKEETGEDFSLPVEVRR